MENEDDKKRLEGFWKLVKAMRSAQVRYFQNRTGDNLYLAKRAERKVDAALRELERDLGDQKLMSF